MINITTTQGMQASPDALFQLSGKKYSKECNSNSTIKDLLHDIDGVTYIDGDIVQTKFGATTLQNIQTGSKAVIIQLLDPSYIIDAFDLGGNVFAWMNKHPEIEFNIRQHGGLTQIPEGVSATIDGKYCADRDSILDMIYVK